MSTSVLDRFFFAVATAIPAIRATPTHESEKSTAEIAGIARIAIANETCDGIAANESDEAPLGWWATFRARIDCCDQLINRLCDLRGDDDARRADLLAVRKRMAPVKLDGDIAYLEIEIAHLTPSVPALKQATGRCIECEHFARVGTGERCAHPDRSPAGEPPRADCLPAHQCERFIHWRSHQSNQGDKL